MKTIVIGLTEGSRKLAETISNKLDDCSHEPSGDYIALTLKRLWASHQGLICIMAAGIVVRSIAPLIRDKRKDPCVIVLDENGKFVISLLSGHYGGGNELARRVASIIGGQPVITTASDVTGHTSIDLWAKENNLTINDPRKLTAVSAKLINQGFVTIYSDVKVNYFPADFKEVGKIRGADIIFY